MADLPAILQELGLDLEAVFGGLGIKPDEMLPDAMINYDTALPLLDRCARVSGNPNFGLMVGARNDQRCLGLIGQLISSAPTLRRALEDYIRVQPAYSGGACVYLVPMGDCYAFGYGIFDRHAAGADQVYGLTAAIGVNMVLSLSGGQVKPLEVHLCQRPPVDKSIYHKVLKTRVHFNEQQTCLFLARETLDAVNPLADRQVHAALIASIANRLKLHEQPISARLRHILRPALSIGDASLEAAAERLGLSERSLNRRLSEAGSTFAAERDVVRFRMACELLLLTDLPIGEVSAALSYSSHSAFIRGFRRWSGSAPADWRKVHSSLQAGQVPAALAQAGKSS